MLFCILCLVGCSYHHPRVIVTTGEDANLFLGVFSGNIKEISSAVQAGANINARHYGLMAAARLDGATPLYAAVFDNKPEIVDWLLSHGADPSIPNLTGETPLQLAKDQKLKRIVEILTKENSNELVLPTSASPDGKLQDIDIPLDKAPVLKELKSGEKIDLGLWDDVFAGEEFNFMVLRRGSEIHYLKPGSDLSVPMANIERMKNSKIVTGICLDDMVWLFCNSEKEGPFAVEVNSKTCIEFHKLYFWDIFSDVPYIQSWVFTPHVKSVLLDFCGASCIWVDLEKKTSIELPSGWQLRSFNATMDMAVFSRKEGLIRTEWTSVGLDMKTGETISKLPEPYKEPWVEYSWETKDRQAYPLYTLPVRGGRIDLSGFSFNGTPYLQKISHDIVDVPYPPVFKARDGWISSYYYHGDTQFLRNYPLFFSQVKADAIPRLLSYDVAYNAVLGAGKCVFSKFNRDAMNISYSMEDHIDNVFVYDAATGKKWDVLEGIDGLPPIDPKLKGKGNIQDIKSVRFVNAFGQGDNGMLLLLFYHGRCDARAVALYSELVIPHTEWRKTILLTSEGRRYQGDLRNEIKQWDFAWLHRSGMLILGIHEWSDDGNRKTHLYRLPLKLD